jgi:hypothetical protein
MLAALQSAVEKAATLLLAKHREQQMNARAAAASSANPGDKRKHTESNVASHKRVKGGVIAPSMDHHATAATAHSAQQPKHASDDNMQLDSRVERALTQVRSLQLLQEQLQKNAESALSGHSSGSSTPSRGRPLHLRSTQPHRALATAPLHQLLQHDETSMQEMKTDDGPASARSDDSMNSEVDSDSAVLQRQHMLAQLAANVRQLQQRIATERARAHPSSAAGIAAPGALIDDDPGMLDESGSLPARSSSSSSSVSVPRLDLSALTSQLGALESLLQSSVDTMAQLAAMQERDMAKREMRRQVLHKTLTPHADAASPFAQTQGAAFAAKPFGVQTNERAGHDVSASIGAYTDAARAQQAMADAVAKLSEVPRAPAAVFGSSSRFADGSAKKQSKAAQRKALYDKYLNIQADIKRALLQHEGAGDLSAAFDATKPRLVQNVVMQPDSAMLDKPPRSKQAAIVERERQMAAERAQALGPGAYEAESALTQRRVQGVPSWGAGPVVAAASSDGDGVEQLAPTERFTVRQPASGTLGPGSHVVREELVTKRIAGPKIVAPASPGDETVQAARARAMAAPLLAKRDELEMQKDYDQLDKTVRRKVPALGALIQSPLDDEPNSHRKRAEQQARERLSKMQRDFEVREAKLEALAQTRRITQMRMLATRRAAFLEAEEDKLERTARLLAAAAGPPDAGDLNPNHDYLLPRKPVFRYAAPKTQADLLDETTKHGQSARKRSTLQLARQAKQVEAAEEKMERIVAKQHEIRALRSSQSAYNMAKMQGHPNAPQATDARDYEAAAAKDFVQLKHAPGDNWARAAPRAIAEPTFDPEVDDIIGGQEGDVLDLAPSDKLVRKRLVGHSFGPKGGPAAALALGLQTLSDTELDYANGVREDPSVLYPNLDFGRKRQGAGGALPLSKQVLGGSRSDGGEDDDEEFPYFVEGNMHLSPRYSAVEPKVKMGKFAVRREEFLKLHLAAKKREAQREAEAAGYLVLNPDQSSAALQRHKPAPSFAFSARHDTGGTADDELDDAEALGDGVNARPARQRGGPGEYHPSFGFKDPHAPSAQFGKATGRPTADSDDDELEGRVDNRDFLGGVHEARPDPNKPVVTSSLPGASFSRSRGRIDADEDKSDFPDTEGAEGNRLDLNPLRPRSGAGAAVSMAKQTGRPEGPDAIDLETQEGSRLDLNPQKGIKHVAGVSFAKSMGRPETDPLDIEAEQRGPDLRPNFDVGAPQVPAAKFGAAERFVEPASVTEGQSDLNPDDAATRRDPRSAIFGTEAARKSHLPAAAANEQNLALVDTDKPRSHVPMVDFSLAGLRMQPLAPLDRPGLQTALQPDVAQDYVAGDPRAHTFGTATRLPTKPLPAPQASELAPVNAPTDTMGTGGVRFGTEPRPGYGLDLGKAEQSILHPNDALLRKSHPSWTFDQARRFGSDFERALDAEGGQLALQPDRTVLEPKSPGAFFAPHDRFAPPTSNEVTKGAEQLLALQPSDELVRARHAHAFVGTEPRWTGDPEPQKQLNLYPNLDAVRPKAPSALLDLSSRRSDAEVAGLDDDTAERPRLRLDPRPALANSPAAHITSSQRSGDQALPGHGAHPYYNTELKLYPDFDSQKPRAPAHSIHERLFDANTYVPSNADIATAKQKRLQEAQQRTAAAAAAAEASREEEEIAILLNPDIGSPRNSARRARGGGAAAEDDLHELEQSAAALSLDGSTSDSFNLPSTGVVANAASLVRARREQQAREAAREARHRAREAQARALALGRLSSLVIAGTDTTVGEAAAQWQLQPQQQSQPPRVNVLRRATSPPPPVAAAPEPATVSASERQATTVKLPIRSAMVESSASPRQRSPPIAAVSSATRPPISPRAAATRPSSSPPVPIQPRVPSPRVAPPSAGVPSKEDPSLAFVIAEPPRPTPTAQPSAAAAVASAVPVASEVRSSSPPVPRRTVQFAEHPQIKTFERPAPEGVRPPPQPKPRVLPQRAPSKRG